MKLNIIIYSTVFLGSLFIGESAKGDTFEISQSNIDNQVFLTQRQKQKQSPTNNYLVVLVYPPVFDPRDLFPVYKKVWLKETKRGGHPPKVFSPKKIHLPKRGYY